MEEPAKEKPWWQTKRKAIIVGALLAVAAACLGAWLLKTYLTEKNPPKTSSNVISTVAMLDLAKVTENHRGSAELIVKREELLALNEELTHILPEPVPEVPVVEQEPFADAVWQKNAQSVFSEVAQIQRYEKELTEQYAKETEEAYLAQRDEINERYFNAILNIRLKLDNQKALHYSQETVNELEKLLAALQQERGEYQHQLAEQRRREIADHVAAIINEKYGDWRAKIREVEAGREAEILRAQTEAQNRNTQLLEQQLNSMNAMDYLQKVGQKREEIAQKELEIMSLESHIFNDIAGLAAKLAIMHHFTLVVTNPATRLDYLLHENWGQSPLGQSFGATPERYAKVMAAGATDITDEIVKELKRGQK